MRNSVSGERRFRQSSKLPFGMLTSGCQKAVSIAIRFWQKMSSTRMENKYALADLLTNTPAIIAQINTLERLGLTADVRKSFDPSKTTTVRFQASDSCTFLKERIVEVPMPLSMEANEEIKTTGEYLGDASKSTVSQIVQNVSEYDRKVDDVSWEVSVYSGTNVEERKILKSRNSSTVLITQSQRRPTLAEPKAYPVRELNLAWLLKEIDFKAMSTQFKIDVENSTTKTPLRNQVIQDALDFMTSLENWALLVGHFFTTSVVYGMWYSQQT